MSKTTPPANEHITDDHLWEVARVVEVWLSYERKDGPLGRLGEKAKSNVRAALAACPQAPAPAASTAEAPYDQAQAWRDREDARKWRELTARVDTHTLGEIAALTNGGYGWRNREEQDAEDSAKGVLGDFVAYAP